jgi:4-hydroxyphenylacetate 3-monooxygenase
MPKSPDLPAQSAGASLRARLHTVFPEIAANASVAESERTLPARNIELVRQAGLFRAFQPRRYGGLEMCVEDFGACLVDLSEACTVTGWVAGLLAQHAYTVALFSRQLQDEIWSADSETLVGSSVAPIQVATPVEGGVQLSGRFGFSSGCDHVQWYIIGFKRTDVAPPHNTYYSFVPRKDVKIIDDWQTAGMRGTGSKSLLLDKVFIPNHRIETIIDLNTGKSRGFGANEAALFHGSVGLIFAIGIAAVAAGSVRRMAALYAEKTRTRIRAYSGSAVAARSPASMRLGRAVHKNEAALAFLEKDWRALDARCASRQMPTEREAYSWRTNQAFSVQLSIQAADELFGGSGASAWFDSNEMQRLWRNVHMCGFHAGTDYDTTSELYGRHLLGLEMDPGL